jgi:outer membrane autotransporter protein
VAGLAIAGASWDAIAQNITYINSTVIPTAATSVFVLQSGDTLINNGSGSISTLTSEAGYLSTVVTAAVGVRLIQNSGTISGATASAFGGIVVYVKSLTSIDTIDNLGGTISGGGPIPVIQVDGTVSTLNNSGKIITTAPANTFVSGILIDNGGRIENLSNRAGGTIAASQDGLEILMGSVGTLSNDGLIQGSPVGVVISPAGTVTSLYNNGHGTIAATAAATFFTGFMFGLDNNGSVASIFNNGLIVGPNGAVHLGTVSTTATLLNTGTLLSKTGTGIIISGAANIPGGIANSTSGLIQGGPSDGSGTAIDASTSTRATTINNAGTIIGAIKQGTGADVLNVNGGSIVGNIAGQAGSGGQVDFNLGSGGSFVTGGSITNVPTVNVNSGMLTVAALSGNAISGASLFQIASGATVTLNANVGATLTSNSGFVNVGTNAISVNGNFIQASTGRLGVSVAGSTFGSLNVSGTANFATAGTGLALHFLSDSTLTSMTVVTSGGLTMSPSLTVSSDSIDPWLLNPVASKVGDNLVVSFLAPTLAQFDKAFNTVVAPTPAPLAGTDSNNQNQAMNGVRQLVESLNGNRQAVVSLLSALNALTPRQLTQFFQQVQPSMLGSAQSLLATALNNNGGLTASVGDRVTALRETVGMSAGDEPGRGFTVWAMPTMKGFTQGQKEGISGFTATSYGAAFGADTLVRPDTRVGLALGLTQTDISFSGLLSGNRNSALTAQAGIYGTWFQNDFFLDGAAGFGYSWYNTKEHIGGFGVTRNGDFGGVQFNAKIAAGYDWRVQGAVITPSIGFQEVHLDIDPHATSGGGVFDLNVAGQHIDVAQMKLGSRFSYPITRSNGWTFTPELHGYYVRNLITSRIVTSASFLAGGTFTSTAPARDTDVADLGLGLTIAQKGPFALSAVYDYAFGQTTKDNTFYLRVKTAF